MMRRLLSAACLAGLIWPVTAAAQPAARTDSVLVRALRAEMARARSLSMPGAAGTYYLGYRVADTTGVRIEAERGGLVARKPFRRRMLAVELRAGDRTLDNSNFEDLGFGGGDAQLTVDEDLSVLQRQVWLATDNAYKRAAEQVEKKRAHLANRTEVRPAELSTESPVQVMVDRDPPALDIEALAALAVELSAAMPQAAPAPFEGHVTIEAWSTGRTFIDSEGTAAYEPSSLVKIEAAASMRSDDGADVVSYIAASARTAAELPSRDELLADVRAMMAQLDALRRAPVIEAYSGPVLFEGLAGAQVVRHLLADNLCGTPRPTGDQFERMASRMGVALETELGDRVGKAVLPAGFDVVDDPLVDRAGGGAVLIGSYAADDEGRPAARVSLVRDGVLQGFLMSRAPRKGAAQSNGHGRGFDVPRARPGNLLVSSRRGLTAAELRRRLLAEARAAGEKYAVVIRSLDDPMVTGAFRDRASMFDMFMSPGKPSRVPAPLAAYRVWPDGREELVRGALLADIPSTALRELVAAGRVQHVHGYLLPSSGASLFGSMMAMFGGPRAISDGAAAAVAAPALLFRRVEVRPRTGRPEKPYVLSPPP